MMMTYVSLIITHYIRFSIKNREWWWFRCFLWLLTTYVSASYNMGNEDDLGVSYEYPQRTLLQRNAKILGWVGKELASGLANLELHNVRFCKGMRKYTILGWVGEELASGLANLELHNVRFCNGMRKYTILGWVGEELHHENTPM